MDKWFVTDDNSDKSFTIICSFYHVLLSIPSEPDLTGVSIYNLPTSLGHFHF